MSFDFDIFVDALTSDALRDGALRVRAGGGRLLVDTLGVAGAAGRLRASGALGLTASARGDTLRADVTVEIDDAAAGHLDETGAEAVYRVAQETLRNAAAHAGGASSRRPRDPGPRRQGRRLAPDAVG